MQKIRPLTLGRWVEFKKYAKLQMEESRAFRPYLFKTKEFNPSESEYHYVVLDGDTVYGYFFLEKQEKTAYIGYGVLNCWKGSGWGTRMVDELLRKSHELGMQVVEAIADKDNYRSILLLYKFGFRVYKEMMDGETPCVAMRKTL